MSGNKKWKLKNYTAIISMVVCLKILSSSNAIFAQIVGSDKQNSSAVIVVSGAEEWWPVCFYQNSEAFGIANDVLREIGRAKNLEIQFVRMPWNRALVEAEKGNIDILAGAYWKKERLLHYEFSTPFYTDDIRVFVVKGKEFPFNGLDDLTNRLGGRPKGGSYGQAFDSFAKKRLTMLEISTHEKLVNMLAYGRLDYIVFAHRDGLINFKNYGYQDMIVALPYSLAKNEVYLMVSKKSHYVNRMEDFNTVISSMKTDGRLDVLMKKYER